jgi:6-pyruvoyl-tetrahydropterin synthase
MPRLDARDVKEILDMLEDEINFISKLDKIEKMKMRSKIRKQANWLLAWSNPTAEMIYQRLEERLSDVFSLYSYGFSDKVKKLLKVRSERLHSK